MQAVDCHLHLADPRIFASAGEIIQEAQSRGIVFFMQGGVDPADWQRQEMLAKRFPGQIGLCFGLHPYFVAANDLETCEKELDFLAQEIHKAMAVGEAGLDFRPHIMKDSRERQIQIFEQQLEIAGYAEKPVVFHLVQAHEEAIRVLDLYGVPERKGLIHAFNSSWGKAKEYIQRGLMISVGGPLCRPDNTKLHEVIKQIPLEYLLLETDSPDQAPPRSEDSDFSSGNRPVSLWRVAEKVAEIRKISSREVMSINQSNFRRLFQV